MDGEDGYVPLSRTAGLSLQHAVEFMEAIGVDLGRPFIRGAENGES